MRLGALGVCVALSVLAANSGVRAQGTPIESRMDSLQRSLLRTQYPCPSPVPLGWQAAVRSDTSGLRCSLLASAARGAAEASASRPRPLIDPRNVVCATVEEAKPSPQFLRPLWRVAFYVDSLRGAEVTLDHFGRQVITVRMIVDLEVPAPQACKPAV